MPVQETIAANPVAIEHLVMAVSLLVGGWWTFRNLDRKESIDRAKDIEKKHDQLAKESISEEKVRQLLSDKLEPFQRILQENTSCVNKLSNDLTDYMRAQGENGVRVRDLERRMDKSEDKGG